VVAALADIHTADAARMVVSVTAPTTVVLFVQRESLIFVPSQ